MVMLMFVFVVMTVVMRMIMRVVLVLMILFLMRMSMVMGVSMVVSMVVSRAGRSSFYWRSVVMRAFMRMKIVEAEETYEVDNESEDRDSKEAVLLDDRRFVDSIDGLTENHESNEN